MPNRRCTSQATGANDTTSVCCHSTSPAPHTVTRGRYTLHTDVTSPPLSSARSKKIHKKNKSHVVPTNSPASARKKTHPDATSNLKHVCSQLRHDRRLRCLCLLCMVRLKFGFVWSHSSPAKCCTRSIEDGQPSKRIQFAAAHLECSCVVYRPHHHCCNTRVCTHGGNCVHHSVSSPTIGSFRLLQRTCQRFGM